MSNLRKNYLYNVVYQLMLLIIPLVTIPYLTRILTPIDFGVYSYTNSVAHYFLLLGMLGISLYGSRQIAVARCSGFGKVNEIFIEIVLLQIFAGGVMFIAYMLYSIYVFFLTENFL